MASQRNWTPHGSFAFIMYERGQTMDRDQPNQNLDGNSDEVPEGTPNSAENICRRCAGSGKIQESECPECGGTGKVLTPIGGAG
jgi:RecJ-like exonuclease